MTTRDIHHRFTASHTLEFLQGFASKLTPEQLRVCPPLREESIPYEEFDRWSDLPLGFLNDWGHFREPKPSYYITVLRRICQSDWGLALVQCVRRLISLLVKHH